MLPKLPLLLLWLLGFVVNTTLSTEYHIKDGDFPSYLYHKFDNVIESVFPSAITINVSFTRVMGTLLYSIDSDMNQLIVILGSNFPYLLEVELNKQRFMVTIPYLCGCERCRYETLQLRVQINYYIELQCNGRQIQRVHNKRKLELNRNYPIIYKSKSSLHKEAHLWLVNTPRFNQLFPDPLQMSGCIFDVFFNTDKILFDNRTQNIGLTCPRTCTKNLCNGGQCYESYNAYPVCNCTATFLNGWFCNKNFIVANNETHYGLNKFDMIKLSWNSSINTIMELQNSKQSVTMARQDSLLYVRYTYLDRNYAAKVTLSGNYLPNKEYIAIIYFKEDFIEIWLLNNGSWNNVVLPIKSDIRKEFFDSVKLRRGDGYIDIVSKMFHDYLWDTVGNIQMLSDDSNEKYTNTATNTTIKGHSVQVSTIASVSIIIPLVVIIGIAMVVFCRWKSRRNRYKSMKETLKNLREKDWVISEGIFSSRIYEDLLSDYGSSSMNSKLLECLRKLNLTAFKDLFDKEERKNCLKLLNVIVETFNDKHKEGIFNEICNNRQLSETQTWKTSCFTLSVAFLSKVSDEATGTRLWEIVVSQIKVIHEHVTRNPVVITIIETFLFALCNITKRTNKVRSDATFCKYLLSYFDMEGGRLKPPSAYLLVLRFNVDNEYEVKWGSTVRVVEYVKETFKNKKEVGGFTVGETEKKTLETYLNKIKSLGGICSV